MGFIGLTLAENLSSLGHQILLLDIEDNNKGYRPYDRCENIDFIKCDINNRDIIENILNETIFDGIIHLGAVSRVVVAQNNPDECLRTNFHGV